MAPRLALAALLGVAALLGAILLAGCGSATTGAKAGKVAAVAAENEYANVIAQVGGRYVEVAAVMSNPNTDPHEFEASASVAMEVSSAQLVVQNGVGYDSFMGKIESASPRASRRVIVAQGLLKVPANAFNPHLWYDPRTMPVVAKAVATALERLQPSHAAYFDANLARFDSSLKAWSEAIAGFKREFPGTAVAVTEPVADYMLEAAGARILTPPSLQSAVMNGTDPSPQDIALEDRLIRGHDVKVVVYNQQVTDSLTESFLSAAKQARVPIVGVYETMPTPGFDYQTWMVAEVDALRKAVADGASTVRLR